MRFILIKEDNGIGVECQNVVAETENEAIALMLENNAKVREL